MVTNFQAVVLKLNVTDLESDFFSGINKSYSEKYLPQKRFYYTDNASSVLANNRCLKSRHSDGGEHIPKHLHPYPTAAVPLCLSK